MAEGVIGTARTEGRRSDRTQRTLWESKISRHPPWVLLQHLRQSADLCDALCPTSTCCSSFLFLCWPFYPHCPINTKTFLEHGIKHLLCKTIPSKRMGGNIDHQFCFPPIYNYSLSICQTLRNKGKRAKIFSPLCHIMTQVSSPAKPHEMSTTLSVQGQSQA